MSQLPDFGWIIPELKKIIELLKHPVCCISDKMFYTSYGLPANPLPAGQVWTAPVNFIDPIKGAFTSQGIRFIHDGGGWLEWTFDAGANPNVYGRVLAVEDLVFASQSRTFIRFRGQNQGVKFRFWAW